MCTNACIKQMIVSLFVGMARSSGSGIPFGRHTPDVDTAQAHGIFLYLAARTQ